MKLTRSLLTLAVSASLFSPLCAENPDKTPDVKVDPSPVSGRAGVITSFAPVVDKVAPSVVTISTSHNVRNGQRGAPGSGNPLFNDPLFRRYFGLPDDDSNPTPKDDGNAQPRRRGGKDGRAACR